MSKEHLNRNGRPPGARNKRTMEFIEYLEGKGFNPAEALLDVYKIAMERFAEELMLLENNRRSPMESHAVQYLKIAGDKAAEIASYAFPKLKAIEYKRSNDYDGLTLMEKLEASKQLVILLEDEVKKNGSKPSEPDIVESSTTFREV